VVHSVHEYVSAQHLVLADGRFLRSVLVNRWHGTRCMKLSDGRWKLPFVIILLFWRYWQ